MSSVKISIPNKFSGGMPSIDDNSKFTPAVIEYDYWINSQMSIAKYYGELKINGALYKLIDSGESAPQGLCNQTSLERIGVCYTRNYIEVLKSTSSKGLLLSK